MAAFLLRRVADFLVSRNGAEPFVCRAHLVNGRASINLTPNCLVTLFVGHSGGSPAQRKLGREPQGQGYRRDGDMKPIVSLIVRNHA
jgi:hypothetical protein